MTDAVLTEIRTLRQQFDSLIANLSPWIGTDEMQTRYGVTAQTLKNMERRRTIPQRINGRWLRSEVIELEQAYRTKSARIGPQAA